jgi:Tol biopolymer transport system component
MNERRRRFAFVTSITVAMASASVNARQCTSSFSPNAGPVALLRVSLTDAGVETNTLATLKNASHPTISDDGGLVAYESTSDAIIDPTIGAVPHTSQIYVREIGPPASTRMISVGKSTSGALTAGRGESGFAVISGDGSHVVFASTAGNLDPDDDDVWSDVFVHDRATRITTRVTELANGDDFASNSGHYSTSFNGATVAFVSAAKALDRRTVDLPGGGSMTYVAGTVADVFLRRASGANFEWLSQAASLGHPNKDCANTSMSHNGRRVAFATEADNMLALVDTNMASDVFLRDRTTGQLELISINDSATSPGPGNDASLRPAVSGDGRFVAFESYATDLAATGTIHKDRIFVRDTTTQTTVCVSLTDAGGLANGNSGYAAISTNGRYVVFTSRACNLVPGDGSFGDEFFVHDRDIDGNGTYDDFLVDATRRLSQRVDYMNPLVFQEANGKCGGNCGISGSGQFAAFNCEASNLIPADPDMNGNACGNGECGRDILRAKIF